MATESQSQGETHECGFGVLLLLGRKEGHRCRAGVSSPETAFHIESTSWSACANRKCLSETHLDSGLVTMA